MEYDIHSHNSHQQTVAREPSRKPAMSDPEGNPVYLHDNLLNKETESNVFENALNQFKTKSMINFEKFNNLP